MATCPSSIPAEDSASAHSSSSSTAVGGWVGLDSTTSMPITSTSSTGARSSLLGSLTRAQLRGRPLSVLVVGGDDPPHELVAHDVLLAEPHELDALHLLEDVGDDDQPGV